MRWLKIQKLEYENEKFLTSASMTHFEKFRFELEVTFKVCETN